MTMGGITLAIFFAIVALLYASVGFGGGSTYIALLALSNVSYAVIPIIGLLCNIIVVTGGSIRFASKDMIPWRGVWPILIFSIPAAWLGGITPISRDIFLTLLGSLLIISAILILVRSMIDKRQDFSAERTDQQFIIPALLGAVIGYISGLVGIGGGIFLAPALLLLRWASPRQIAATASIFILLNSLAGLMGQMGKYDGILWNDVIIPYLSLFIAVFIGGQMGSLLAVKILPENIIRILTIILTLYIGIRILLID